MSPTSPDVDAYLAALPEPQRTTLTTLRQVIRDRLPNASECISYGVPTFKVDGKSVAGFAAYKHHCSYLPMSGSVLSDAGLRSALTDYQVSKGALKFPVDEALDPELVDQLIQIRIGEL